DAEDMHGIVTDVCLKRKVRNYVQVKVAEEYKKGYDIFVKDKAVLDSLVDTIYNYNAVKEIKNIDEKKEKAKEMLCKNYYDIRTFGQVIATSDRTDQVRGPIQLTFARSVDEITPRALSITRMAVNKEEQNNDAEEKRQKERTMGRKNIIPYGLYICHGFISANLAKQTGFSEEDLEMFWEALKNMFDMDRSAARGLMSAQKLIVFKHDSPLGNAPANKLFDLVKVKKKEECKGAPRSFGDYTVTIDKEHIPSNVTVEELI
ncbi:MAG: type I-C CRISPR-associated protein Cas7/Csd2, partial [Prevotella sp.]|nr:type I-C CRISPR-associated protein Cas7/Csd2 [Prevotella sp.]